MLEYVTAISTALTSIKTLRELLKKNKLSPEIMEQVDLVKEHLLDASKLALALEEYNLRLKEELFVLKKERESVGNLEFNRDQGVYYGKAEGMDPGPYCPTCWDGDRKLIHLQKTRTGWSCYYCETAYMRPAKFG